MARRISRSQPQLVPLCALRTEVAADVLEAEAGVLSPKQYIVSNVTPSSLEWWLSGSSLLFMNTVGLKFASLVSEVISGFGGRDGKASST